MAARYIVVSPVYEAPDPSRYASRLAAVGLRDVALVDAEDSDSARWHAVLNVWTSPDQWPAASGVRVDRGTHTLAGVRAIIDPEAAGLPGDPVPPQWAGRYHDIREERDEEDAA